MISISILAIALLAHSASNHICDRSGAAPYFSHNTVGMLAVPAMLPSVTVLLEAIAQTTAALIVAYTAHDWTEADRLQTTLKQLEEELEEAEADSAVDDDDDELNELDEDEEIDEDNTEDEGADEENEPATIEDVLAGAEPGPETKGKSEQFIKTGDLSSATEDFYSLNPTNIKSIAKGYVGSLPDGRTVNVRIESSYGTPTLEIYNPINSAKIKIRYTS